MVTGQTIFAAYAHMGPDCQETYKFIPPKDSLHPLEEISQCIYLHQATALLLRPILRAIKLELNYEKAYI